ncbi:MAG: VOC family protein [Actinomycetota bacterium]|nr:VOC family protein [Actinomycetota bacterium]
MLADAPAVANIPVSDLGRAAKFYEDVLGVSRTDEFPGAYAYTAGVGSQFSVSESTGASDGSFTQMVFIVTDIEKTVDDLKARGLIFEEYDGPFKTENGIATVGRIKGAWFKDPEGNLLGLFQGPKG